MFFSKSSLWLKLVLSGFNAGGRFIEVVIFFVLLRYNPVDLVETLRENALVESWGNFSFCEICLSC